MVAYIQTLLKGYLEIHQTGGRNLRGLVGGILSKNQSPFLVDRRRAQGKGKDAVMSPENTQKYSDILFLEDAVRFIGARISDVMSSLRASDPRWDWTPHAPGTALPSDQKALNISGV